MYDSRLLKGTDFLLEMENRKQATSMEQAYKCAEKRKLLDENYSYLKNCNQKFSNFRSDLTDVLLTEALYTIFKHSVPETISEELLQYGKNAIYNFVVTEGANKLLTNFESKTLLLSEMSSIIRESECEIVSRCDKTDDSTFCIKNSEFEKFRSKLSNLDINSVTKAIADRVQQAESEFVEANLKDKELMEDLAQKTKDRIDAVRASSDEEESEIKQEHARLYKRQLSDNVIHRKKNILESMITKFTNKIVTTESLNESFVLENSTKIDMDKVINMSEVLYTVLEMVNTCKIRTVDQIYITELLSSI